MADQLRARAVLERPRQRTRTSRRRSRRRRARSRSSSSARPTGRCCTTAHQCAWPLRSPRPRNTERVRARQGAVAPGTAARPATWNLRVLDNTNRTPCTCWTAARSIPASNQTRNLTATTGWGGISRRVHGPRAAAPFAVLDTLYAATQFVITQGDSAVQFPALAAYWSETTVRRTAFDPAPGEIDTTPYVPRPARRADRASTCSATPATTPTSSTSTSSPTSSIISSRTR